MSEAGNGQAGRRGARATRRWAAFATWALVSSAGGLSGCFAASAGTSDAGAPLTRLSYTPEGCGYSVTTPELLQTGRSDNRVGTGLPEEVHASLAGPPATTLAIGWRTDLATTAGEVLYGTDPGAVAAADGPMAGDPSAEVRRQRGHYMRYGSLLDGDTMVHEAHLCGLTPDTNVYYKVGAPGRWSPVRVARTAPLSGPESRLRFAVAGDSRNDPTVLARLQRLVVESGATMQVFTGDAVYDGASQPQWQAFFGSSADGFTTADALSQVPVLMANGNHDKLAVNYLAQFALPQERSEGEGADGEEWYAVDAGPVHFVALNDTSADAGRLAGAELRWLEQDLAAVDRTRTPWVVVFHHRPLYSCGRGHGSNEALRRLWQPVYDKYGVDLVLNGHDHDYERSKPIRGLATDGVRGVVATDGPGGVTRGTTYVVAGGAGAPLYDVGRDCYWTARIEPVHHVMVVDAGPRTLEARTLRRDGSELDRFTLTRP